ncbi:protein FANTASTIC FOUR 4-like [Magnolia sinica]|uniref:protein FANTASTIC FOUR 4-like n=1 Tax=Magnolia sinica TaxID=86752 RepID=UPI00265B2D16|nr:protein FANTASTIC FOUR 4-like [Magnolia sinica]
MSSTIFQGLQSCLEPRLIEKRVLTLRLASPKLQISHKADSQDINFVNGSLCMPEPDIKELEKFPSNAAEYEASLGGWSSIYSLTNTQKESTYKPPLFTRSSSTLSEKSLELCTENLGCETGSDIASDDGFNSSPHTDSGRKSPLRWEGRRQHKNSRVDRFPPPLTTIAGQDCIRVRPQREGGRLVLKAIPVPSPRACFQAERSDGHLRLRFHFETEASEKEVDESDGVEVEQEAEIESGEERSEEDMNDNEINDGGEMGIESFQRPSRCKEGGNEGLVIWEPCWVATS